MTPFQERNPATIGLVGIAIIIGFMFLAFRADKLPIVGGGDYYEAEFAEIGGLVSGDEVRMSGVSVGKVDGMTLKGDKVLVKMRVKTDARIGTESTATVKVRTLLGAYYVSIDSLGPGQLPEDQVIPIERTRGPYDVVMAFTDLTDTTIDLDEAKVADAIRVLGDVLADSQPELNSAVAGLGAVSNTLAARDQEINTLLTSLERAAGVLNSRSDQIEQLIKDSNQLFAAVAARRESIHNLLQAAQTISNELRALVRESRADLKPALDQMTEVTDLLAANVESFDEALRVSPAFFGGFADTLGSGPWFDVFTKISLGGVS